MAAHPPKNCRHVYLEMSIDTYSIYSIYQTYRWDYPIYMLDYPTCTWDYPIYMLDYPTCRWDYPTYISDYPTCRGIIPHIAVGGFSYIGLGCRSCRWRLMPSLMVCSAKHPSAAKVCRIWRLRAAKWT